jgi:hypothetical protein
LSEAERSRQPGARSSGGRLALGALLLGLFVARGALVVSLADVFFYGEELAKAAAGVAMLGDVGVEHHRLAYNAYEGGGFVFSHLDALAFRLVGPNLLALKLVAIAWTALILWAGFSFCDRHFGRASAVLFGLLFVLAPGTFQKLSLLSLGIHFEALLFVILLFDFGFRILFEDESPLRTWFVAGLVGGLGTYFSYSCAPAVAFLGLAILLHRRRRLFGRPGACALAGVILGLLPWFWMWLRVGNEVFDIHGVRLLDAEATAVPESARLGGYLAALFGSRLPWELAALGLVPLVLVAGWVRTLRKGTRDSRILLLSLYLIVFLLVYAFSGFAEGNLEHWFSLKRLSQAWLLATLLVAVFLARWWTEGKLPVRLAALAAAAVLAIAGAMDTIAAIRAASPRDLAGNVRRLSELKGYWWTGYVRNFEEHLEGDTAQRLRVLLRLPEPHAGYLDPAISDQLWLTSREEFDTVRALCEREGGSNWRCLLLGLGTYWRRVRGPNIQERVRAVEALPAEDRPYLLEAIGRDALGSHVDRENLGRQIARGLDKGMPDPYFVGLGYRMHECLGEDLGAPNTLARVARPWIFHPELVEDFVAGQTPRVAACLREGYARAVRERSLGANGAR